MNASEVTGSTGGTNLSELLRHMSPMLREGEYVIANVTAQMFATLDLTTVESMFREGTDEITVIMTHQNAVAANVVSATATALTTFGWITLTVHSSLEAVGLTAAFARALGAAGISCNVVAAYFHDHIFVPSADASRAVEVLRDLARANGGDGN